MDVEQMWDRLIEMGVDEDVLKVVTSINGYNETSLNDILYAKFGYRDFEQMDEED